MSPTRPGCTMRHLAVFAVLLFALVLTACGPATFVVGTAPSGKRLAATKVQDDERWNSAMVVVVDVSGTIVNAEPIGLLSTGENPVSALSEQLNAAAADPAVAAVILRLNTPGGTVTASDMMYRELVRFRQASGKPVVALMMDLATSGGYYLACGADEIVAYPTTITGSVGVIMQTLSVKPALSRLGVNTDAIMSGPNKAIGSPLETLTGEQRAILQETVDEFYRRFVGIVRERRTGIPPEKFGEVTDGRVFTGTQAFEVGLVDRVGDIRDAFEVAKRLAGAERADLWVYHRPLDYVATAYSRNVPGTPAEGVKSGLSSGRGGSGVELNLLKVDAASLLGSLGTKAGVYYLWSPGVAE